MLNSPGFCDQETLLYLAQHLEPVPTARHGEEERYIEVVEVPLRDIASMIASGELVDAQTLLGLLLARDALRNEAFESPGVTPAQPST
jgi:ADP-ribose pyrophosphatase